jgi:hypothetical protein
VRTLVTVALVSYALVLAPRAEALEPEQIFDKASPSVVTVTTLDATGRLIGQGSGVVIAPGEIVTNCHVVEDGARWQVKKNGRTAAAYVRFYDEPRDLCQLHAARSTAFTRPIRGLVAIDDLKVGQRVYAIGGPQGFELTLSDGLISGLRQSEHGSFQLIQTSAPISPGSSGGGLFDQDGRLIGITTFLMEDSQNLNFALPASWVLELSSRQVDLAARRAPEPQPRAAGSNPPASPDLTDADSSEDDLISAQLVRTVRGTLQPHTPDNRAIPSRATLRNLGVESGTSSVPARDNNASAGATLNSPDTKQ